jgi:hypothetical protein
VRKITPILCFIGLLGLETLPGCYPAPQRAAPPPASGSYQHDAVKPMPEPTDNAAAQPGFDDVALVNQQIPEQPRFVQAYAVIGRPRILVFVNRTLEGQLLPVNDTGPLATIENTKQSDAAVKINSSSNTTNYGYWNTGVNTQNNDVESPGQFKYVDRTQVYLRPGEYDEAAAKQVDYGLIENTLTDWLSADGQVTIISPIAARQRLTDQQVQELQSGRPQMMGEIAQKLQTDVLVQVECRPSRQTTQGLVVTLLASAMNTRGGQQIAQASVQIPLPMEKTTINRYTRFVARKLMDEMTNAWNARAALPPPATQPALR